MCGIFCVVANKGVSTDLSKRTSEFCKHAARLQHRGPDESSHEWVTPTIFFAFHRLAINGLGRENGQPLHIRDCTLICNGEIYNHADILHDYNITPITKNDCEAIVHLYRQTDCIEKTLLQLRGEFAFCLYDHLSGELFVANDVIGVRPLFQGLFSSADCELMAYASEPRALTFCTRIEWFRPGTVQTHNQLGAKAELVDYLNIRSIPCTFTDNDAAMFTPKYISLLGQELRTCLTRAVRQRVTNTDRPVACLLSGGLDSSLVCALAARILAPSTLHTFTIGFADSPDVLAARMVARHIGSAHTEVIVTKDDVLQSLEEVVAAIQSYDVTTVRASAFNFLLAKYIAHNTQFKVILNGDCSEEVHGSYAYFRHAPTPAAFLNENQRLLSEVYMYDGLRSARCIEHFGMEARTPFADVDYVFCTMMIPPQLKMFGPTHHYPIEKGLLRESFSGNALLPLKILQRPKTAFSDGISHEHDSWHVIVQRHCEGIAPADWLERLQGWAKEGMAVGPQTPEAFLYAFHFERHCKGQWNLIPHHWMPRFVKASDPSARTLAE